MRNAVVWFKEAKYRRQGQTTRKNGLTLPHKTFAVFTYFGNIRDSQRGSSSTVMD